MIYKFIENLARLIMEWALGMQYNQRPICDEVCDSFSYKALKGLKVK